MLVSVATAPLIPIAAGVEWFWHGGIPETLTGAMLWMGLAIGTAFVAIKVTGKTPREMGDNSLSGFVIGLLSVVASRFF